MSRATRNACERAANVIARHCGNDYAYTLDGNENFKAVEPFRAFWSGLVEDSRLHSFLERLIFVEQPLHRSVALSDEVAREFLAWKNRPPIIIDESDATLTSARQAIGQGYVGTSHKNCKGVIKGIANGCLLEHRRRSDRSRAFVQSAEDLTNIGPVALMQDLCVLSDLGIPDAERNGHHYFKGISMFPADVQQATLAAHPDLYRRHADGYVTTRISAARWTSAAWWTKHSALVLTLTPPALRQSINGPMRHWSRDEAGKVLRCCCHVAIETDASGRAGPRQNGGRRRKASHRARRLPRDLSRLRRRRCVQSLMIESPRVKYLEPRKLPASWPPNAAAISSLFATRFLSKALRCISTFRSWSPPPPNRCALRIKSIARISAKTGVEMEALTAVSVAALTVYDMCKAIDKTMTIDGIRLLQKTGGSKRGQ